MVFFSDEDVFKQLNDVLQLKIYDVIESPFGFKFLSNLLRDFIQQNL